MKLLAIISTDAGYAARLADWLNAGGQLSLRAVPYTSREELSATGGAQSRRSLAALLVDRTDPGEGITSGENTKFGEPVPVLSLTADGRDGTVPKYARGDVILGRLVECLSAAGISCTRRADEERGKIYAVWTPESAADRLMFSMSLARYFSSRKNTVYVNFNEFTGFRGVSGGRTLSGEHLPLSGGRSLSGEGLHPGEICPQKESPGRGGLSRAAYYLKEGKLDGPRLQSLLEMRHGFSYLAPAMLPQDLEELSDADRAGILHQLANGTCGEAVVAEVPWGLTCSEGALEESDVILVPFRQAPVSAAAVAEMESVLGVTGRKDLLEKIRKAPYEEIRPEGNTGPDGLIYEGIGELIRRILDERPVERPV